MNKRILPALAAGLSLTFQTAAHAALSPAQSDEFNGQEAPVFSAVTVKGDTVSLKDFKGRLLMVNFFASWCPPCRSEIAQLSQLHKQYAKQGLMVVGFAMDSVLTPETVGDVKPLAEKLAIPYPVAMATKKLAGDYHFKGIPTTMVIGKDGKIAGTFYGYHDEKAFDELIQHLLKESPTADAPAPSKRSAK